MNNETTAPALTDMQEQIKQAQKAAAPVFADMQEQIKQAQKAAGGVAVIIQSKIKPLQDLTKQMQGRAALLVEQTAGIISALQEAAANCLRLSAVPQPIRPQITYFAQIAKAQITAFDTEKAAAGITAYYEAHRAEIAEFKKEAAARLAAEQEAETAKAAAKQEAAARLATEQENRRLNSELEKARAELALYRAAVDYQKILQKNAGPQSETLTTHNAPATIQPRADFSPEIAPAEINAIFEGLPQDFRPTKAQFAALFGRPINMPAPIETTPGRAAALLAALYSARFIHTAKYAAIAAARQCFKYNGRIITAKQLRRAKEANKTTYTPADFDYIEALNQ